MEQWDIIKNNPKFQYAIGPQVTGDPNEWWMNLPQDMKDSFISLYGDTSAPVLNQQTQNEVGPALTGYEDYGPNDFMAEATGENAANRVSQEDYNVNMDTGVLGTKNFNTRSDAQFANMDPAALQQLADAGNPTAQAMLRANVRQPFEGPVLNNNMNAPAAGEGSLAAAENTVNNVVTTPPALGMNEEAGRGNIYDNPVLIDTTKPNNETTAGVLGTTGGPSVRSIMSSSGPKTSNRRQSNIPSMLVDRNEALIRIGGAMYSGGLQGDGIGAATREYGAIQDANRKTAMEKYKTDQATKLAAAKAAAKGKGKDAKTFEGMNSQMDSYKRALQAIADSRAAGGNLTGVGGIFKSFLDNFTGDEDGARRLILSKVKVDDALLRVAHTKGAISNAEMKLFLSPAPKNYQDEAIWEAWLNERVDALTKVQMRLATGQEVPPEMSSASVEATRSSIANEASGSDDGQYIVEQTAD